MHFVDFMIKKVQKSFANLIYQKIKMVSLMVALCAVYSDIKIIIGVFKLEDYMFKKQRLLMLLSNIFSKL